MRTRLKNPYVFPSRYVIRNAGQSYAIEHIVFQNTAHSPTANHAHFLINPVKPGGHYMYRQF